MEGRGLVLTTTNKARLDETVGQDSEAFEVAGKPYDLDQITGAIRAALKRARDVKRTPATSGPSEAHSLPRSDGQS
jgi:hypothetical protein